MAMGTFDHGGGTEWQRHHRQGGEMSVADMKLADEQAVDLFIPRFGQWPKVQRFLDQIDLVLSPFQLTRNDEYWRIVTRSYLNPPDEISYQAVVVEDKTHAAFFEQTRRLLPLWTCGTAPDP
jgi:hypothetical protein